MRMNPMLLMVRMINDHDDGCGGDEDYIDIRHLTSTIMRMTRRAMINNDTD